MSDAPPITDITAPPGWVTQTNAYLDALLTKLRIPLGNNPGTPPAPPPASSSEWTALLPQLAYDWPGYNWPAKFDPVIVAGIFDNITARIQGEAQYLWQRGLAIQLELDWLYHLVVVAEKNIGALEANAPTVSQVAGLTGDLAALQTEIQAVAANAWSNLWSLYNNQVVPLADQVAATAWNNLWSVYNNEVVPLIQQQARVAWNNLWSVYNNQVVPLVAGEATARSAGDAQLSVALTQETAQRQADTNTLHGQITNETARATGVESNILRFVIPTAIAGLATQVETQLAPIRTELQTCVEPLCDTVTPNAKSLGNLGKLLTDLTGLFEAGVLGALLVAAVKDPKDTAQAVVDVTGWMPKLGVDLVKVIDGALGNVL